MATPLRVLYVFTARKRGLLAQVARGQAPDTLLFGFNHLAADVAGSGISPAYHEPDYPPLGQALARQAGRLGPDFLQLRTLRLFPAYDLVFLTGGWPLLLAAQAIPLRRRPKLVWLNMTLTNLLRRPRPLTRMIDQAMRRADGIICVARHQQEFLRQRFDWPAARLPLALSGTDATYFHPARTPSAPARPARRPIVLAPGRDAGRDYATLLQAIPPGVDLRLVCSPANLAGLQLPSGVTTRFDIPPAALREEYGAASLVVIPTQGDGSVAGSDCSGTLVLLDALAMGRPAVITERHSVHDYVVPGTHVATVPAARPEALRAAVDRLIADPQAAGDLGRAGQAHVQETLTTGHFARRLASLFHQLAAAPAGERGTT
jgi:glycosyltransferase involved in cell wall biosynthesis